MMVRTVPVNEAELLSGILQMLEGNYRAKRLVWIFLNSFTAADHKPDTKK